MKTWKLPIAAISLLVTFVNAAAQDNLLEIRVVDDYTARPIPSAQVTLWGDGVKIGAAQTDGSGIAVFALPTGTHEPPNLPRTLTLSPNYPNPFLDETRVDMAVPEEQVLTATLYNILGQRVATQQLPVQAGYHTLTMSLGHLATGVYFLRVDGRTSQTVSLFRMGGGVQRSGPAFSVAPGPAPAGDPAGTPGPIPVRLKQGSGASAGSSTTAGTIASGGSAATPGFTSTSYTIRVEKDRYDIHEGTLSNPPGRSVAIPLSRNNLVDIVLTDAEGAPVERALEIKRGSFQLTITPPQTVTLKSGAYGVLYEIEQDVRISHPMEIPSVDTTIVVILAEGGVLLAGDPELPAMDAAYNLHIPIAYPEEMISADPELLYDGQVLRTEVEIIFDPGVTVARVNEVLEKYDAKIVSMLEENTIFVVRIPDPGDIDALNQLVAEIRGEDNVLSCMKSVIVEEQEPFFVEDIATFDFHGFYDFHEFHTRDDIQQVPEHITGYGRIDHHLAVRGHAAWNLRDAIKPLQNRPWLVIGDLFGDGTPGQGYNARFTNTDFSTSTTSSHGYHVLGIITGHYDSVSTLAEHQNDVVGMFPEQVRVRAVDLRDTLANTWPRRKNLLIERVQDILRSNPNARIVMSTSLNSRNIADQKEAAYSWIGRVRGVANAARPGAGLENRFIHFTSTGNARVTDGQIIRWQGRDNSMLAYAALVDVDLDTLLVPRLANTFVVENRVNTGHLATESQKQRPLPGCANDISIMGGNLSAMGTRVWSFGATVGGVQYSDTHASTKIGTSMATPQAAGVAVYTWAVNPTLSAGEVIDIIRKTAEARNTTTLTPGTPLTSCNSVAPQPVVDAYAAVLAAGGTDVRRALLDVTGNGVFDHHDIEKLIGIFTDPLGTGLLNYSRYDLNGNGITGGEETDRFDLDMDGEHKTNLLHTIEGEYVIFNENQLTDLEILCYYAWSPLYQGSAEQRTSLLGGPCAGKPETGVVMDYDNYPYRTIKIGDQWWMAENLRTTRYSDGTPIPHVTGNSNWVRLRTPAYTWYNDDQANMGAHYGALYNWYAVNTGKLCPDGWRVPTDADWANMMNYLVDNDDDITTNTLARTLKSCRQVSSPLGGECATTEHPRWNNHGSHYGSRTFGFNALPGGARSEFDGISYNIGGIGYWWTATPAGTTEAVQYSMHFGFSTVNRADFFPRSNANSIRCVSD